jgi:hypothetical protein
MSLVLRVPDAMSVVASLMSDNQDEAEKWHSPVIQGTAKATRHETDQNLRHRCRKFAGLGRNQPAIQLFRRGLAVAQVMMHIEAWEMVEIKEALTT